MVVELGLGKVLAQVGDAMAGIPDGASVGLGGFGVSGTPLVLMAALVRSSVRDIEVVANNGGLYDWALGPMLAQGRVRRVVASHIGGNRPLERAFREGRLEVELVPQGTFSERLRAAGAGIPAFFTSAGAGTLVESGGVPWLYSPDGSVARASPPKSTRTFNGLRYVMEEWLPLDVALIHAAVGDAAGNLLFHQSARNFNPALATAARLTIAEVERLVPVGELDPDAVHLPGIFVDRVLEVGTEAKFVERPLGGPDPSRRDAGDGHPGPPDQAARRRRIAARAAKELRRGDHVNLGIGIPTLVAAFLNPADGVILHSENGILGLGPPPEPGQEDPDLTDAGKDPATVLPGASFFDSVTSFSIIRGGHLDVAVLGAMEVSARGDLANWMIPGRAVAGMGGAMDLVAGAKRVIAATFHAGPDGTPKIVAECGLPVTGRSVVDTIVTDLAVIDVTRAGLVLRELAPDVSVEQVQSLTGAPLAVPRRPGVMSGP